MPSQAESANDPNAALQAAPRFFSPSDADRLVPHLETEFEAIGKLRIMLAEALEGLEKYGIDLDLPLPEKLADDPEVSRVVELALAAHKGLRDALIGLEELGVEVKALDGLVDVRSRHDGRIVFLCWKRGEARFGHWHETDQGYAGRMPIGDRKAFEGSLLH